MSHYSDDNGNVLHTLEEREQSKRNKKMWPRLTEPAPARKSGHSFLSTIARSSPTLIGGKGGVGTDTYQPESPSLSIAATVVA